MVSCLMWTSSIQRRCSGDDRSERAGQFVARSTRWVELQKLGHQSRDVEREHEDSARDSECRYEWKDDRRSAGRAVADALLHELAELRHLCEHLGVGVFILELSDGERERKLAKLPAIDRLMNDVRKEDVDDRVALVFAKPHLDDSVET